MGLLTLQQRRYRTVNGDTRQASNVYHLNLAGMLAGSFDSRPKREKTSSSPGCQTVQSQGDNGVSRRTCHKELTIPVPVPEASSSNGEPLETSAQEQEPGPGGAVAPAEDSPSTASGKASPAIRGALRTAATEDEWDRVFACLPSRMAEELPPAKIPQIASYLAERINAGWPPGQHGLHAGLPGAR